MATNDLFLLPRGENQQDFLTLLFFQVPEVVIFPQTSLASSRCLNMQRSKARTAAECGTAPDREADTSIPTDLLMCLVAYVCHYATSNHRTTSSQSQHHSTESYIQYIKLPAATSKMIKN